MPEPKPMPDLVLSGGRVVDPASGLDDHLDVSIEGGRISGLAPIDLEAAQGDRRTEIVDCRGMVVAPGLVDLHAHLRQPGHEHKETVESGTRAAALGGYTAVCAMGNTDPPADGAAVIAEVRELAAAAGLADVLPVGTVTRGRAGEELAELGEMVEAGVRIFSDDGDAIPTARLLRNALTYLQAFSVDAVIAEHCEDPSLVEAGQMHEGVRSTAMGLAGRPAVAEEVIVARDVSVARLTGGRLHLCHLSSAAAVELVRRAKADGIRVTAEVTPHHLTFVDDDLHAYDTNLKVHPPLRTAADRDALRAGLADGTIDAIATDHAPHAVEEKEAEFDRAPPGTIGLETALAVVLTELVHPGVLPLGRALAAMSAAPAAIAGAEGHGGPIEIGRPANLVVFDPEAAWVVQPPFASMARNSAFTGRELRGRVVHTFLRGAATVVDGKPAR
jgi:dihydroorotase